MKTLVLNYVLLIRALCIEKDKSYAHIFWPGLQKGRSIELEINLAA